MISEQIGLDLLRTYVAVCRQGSLSRVAAQTGRTQSSLSMQMRRLEGLLQRHLFQRTGRRRATASSPRARMRVAYPRKSSPSAVGT
ncbi:MAG: LysR family transcriptional regulator, partial [Mesorhizobium sp.]